MEDEMGQGKLSTVKGKWFTTRLVKPMTSSYHQNYGSLDRPTKYKQIKKIAPKTAFC